MVGMESISNKELQYFSELWNISIVEAEQLILLMLKENRRIHNGIEMTIKNNGYVKFPNNLTIYGYGEKGELNRKYISYTPNIPLILKKPKSEVAIVSGFGATNAPTAGTLSMILKLLEFQKMTGLYTYLIINDLGTINARNIDGRKVIELTNHFIDFIEKVGFNNLCGEIRTHDDLNHARVVSLISRVIKLSDFDTNIEATDFVYDRLNIRGNDFSAMLDHVYTAADCILPIIKDQKKAIIVPCGLEEFYHANIGGIALQRLLLREDMKDILYGDIQIGCIHSKIIPGFYPYFKQSKSISQSSLSLGDSKDQIQEKVLNNIPQNDEIILEIIRQCTSWNLENIAKIEEAFENRDKNSDEWVRWKSEFVDWFISFKEIWDSYQGHCTSLSQLFKGEIVNGKCNFNS